VAPPLDIYDRPATKFVAGFIGTPPMNFLTGRLVAADGALCFDEGTARLRLPEAWRGRLEKRLGRSVTLGIRPESITERRPAPDAAPGTSLGVTVNVVEPLGDEMLLYLSTGKHDLIAKVDAHQRVEVGQSMEIALDVARGHVFDSATGENLTVAPATA
jgi:multiple sugar transport system ATP-binding protein